MLKIIMGYRVVSNLEKFYDRGGLKMGEVRGLKTPQSGKSLPCKDVIPEFRS